MNERTRSIIEHSFWGFLFRLTRDPIYSLFCSKAPNINPESSLEGHIILIDLPSKMYDKVGQDAQILFKYIWQRAIERRDVLKDGGRPVFLWADEAQNFLHEHDIDYQATARSSRVCTVYPTQNLPNYLTRLGGREGEHRVKSFLGTLGTKIFHANADNETNEYAAKLVGQTYRPMPTYNINQGKEYTKGEGFSWQKDWELAPESFVSLKTGGPKNNYSVQAVLHTQGKTFNDKSNAISIHFNQLKILTS